MTAKWLINLKPVLSTPTEVPRDAEKNDRTLGVAKMARVARGAPRGAPMPRDAKRVQSFVPRGRGR
ncbi:MAG: hypothetical protein K0R38_6761 [Polyangiaceae bacterium]|jgi:hypothetical protein|nr:hypothetical protein [Polyangiaceae bacterium]